MTLRLLRIDVSRRVCSLFVACTAIFFASCDKLFPVDIGQGQGNGVVLRVDTLHNQVTLDHQEIPQLIEGMTFSYPVRTSSMLEDLHPLDSVRFTLRETSPGDFEVESITKVGRSVMAK